MRFHYPKLGPALDFAVALHEDHDRKTRQPISYLSHLLTVTGIVLEHGRQRKPGDGGALLPGHPWRRTDLLSWTGGHLAETLAHHCRSQGTPLRLPSTCTPGQLLRKNVASAHEVISEQ